MKRKKDHLRNIKVCIADDHRLVRDAMVALIETFQRVTEVYAVGDGQQLVDSIPTAKPDIVLLDIKMPNMNGVEASEIILKEHPDVRILILTMNDDREVMMNLLQMGVHGYITKSAAVEVVEKAIYQVMDDGNYFAEEVSKALVDNMRMENFMRPKTIQGKMEMTRLSAREMEIVKLMCEELENDSIAKRLNISVKTIQTHKHNIYKKTGAKSLISLYRFAIKAGLIDL